MKKILKGLLNVIVMAILFLTCAFGGFFLSVSLFSGFFSGLEVILGIVGIFVVFYISIIAHEAGHLLFGLMSGYGFSSFRIGSFMWIKQEGKIKFRRLSIAGTGGQCLMIPPEMKNGKIPVILYNLGGVIANLILTVIFVLGYFACINKMLLVALVFLLGGIISFILALTNGLPLNIGGISNDGMNAIHLSKNREAAIAFQSQLLMNAEQSKGVRISDMPDEWFTLPDGADKKNVHCASIAVFAASRALDKQDTLLAEQQITELLNSDYAIIGLHKNLLKCDLVYARLLNYGRSAELSSLLGIEQLKFMKSMKTYPSVLRTEYAISLLRDGDEAKAKQLRANFEKAAKKYPYPGDIASERALLALADKKYKNEKAEI